MQLTAAEVQEILRVFLDSDLQEIDVETGDVKVHASKRTGAANPSASAPEPTVAATPVAETEKSEESAGRDGLVAVTAPLLGTFYRRPAPGQPPFVEVGSEVDAQDPVCIIEVMKLFNQIHAECKGRVVDIVVEDGAMVEFGQPLLWVEPVVGG